MDSEVCGDARTAKDMTWHSGDTRERSYCSSMLLRAGKLPAILDFSP